MDATNSKDAKTTRGFSVSRRAGGVRHPPEADIESIRDLLRGYESSRAILKELVQNAEDAGATRMDVLFVPGEIDSSQSLLRGPGLLVANDGAFIEEHRDAISQISLGTKGTEDRAIGRFGKGLKSVFAWCEAFFVVARTDLRLGWTEPYVTDLFNPWYGCRHRDWDEEFKASGDALVSRVETYLGETYSPGQSWLALWFPLRRRSPVVEVSQEDWILQIFPGDTTDFFQELSSDLWTLAPSLVTLRSLQRINLFDRKSDIPRSLSLTFQPRSQRIPAPDEPPGTTFVEGTINIKTSDSSDTNFQYCGFAGRLPGKEIAHLKPAADWPRVARRSVGKTEVSCPVKGEPHFATLVTSTAADDNRQGTLDFRWCVFFPVGKQPPGKLTVGLTHIRRQVTINLHGFFFLDSERLRIDGLEERFVRDDLMTGKTCIDWNGIVSCHGTLARLPEAVARFAQRESFKDVQCRDLADAIRTTWVWNTFAREICWIQTWRPRWRSGNEQWEVIPAEAPVWAVPDTKQTREVLECIPFLGTLSEELTLVAGDQEERLPGLHFGRPRRWAEDRVLQLLKDVHLEQPDDSAATWINEFLDSLHDHGDITPKIRERVSELPLLLAQESRKKGRVRLSPNEWRGLAETHKLFLADDGTAKWVSVLCGALPSWSCFLARELPRWFGDAVPPVCNGLTAAQVVLDASHLGSFVDRRRLVEALTSEIRFGQAIVRAIRFLMHADPSHPDDDEKLLFLASTQQGQRIWARVLDQLLARDGGKDSWRLLHDEWTPVLSPQLQGDLNVSTVDAKGLWAELMNCGAGVSDLEFPVKLWGDDDVCIILAGLFQAGGPWQQDETASMLRRLRLHKLRGQPDERVSIADEEGGLSDLFILNKKDFETDLPAHLRPLWQGFLSETHVVEELSSDALASTVQRNLFQRKDADGVLYVAELDWNHVVRRCLDTPISAERAPLIMEALSRGDRSVRGLGTKLKRTPWLPVVLGGSVAPDYVIHIEGLEDDLHRLIDPTRDGLAGIRALEGSIRGHAGFATLQNYLPRIERALEILALWLNEKSEWHLGLTKQGSLSELEPILSQLKDFEDVPAAAFLLKLRGVRIPGYDEGIDALITEHVLPALLKPFDYSKGGRGKIETILHRLEGKQNRSAFDAYLTQACKDGQVQDILPRISLVNQRGQWLAARRLIWPSSNLDPNAQLCAEQTEILAPLHHVQERARMQSSAGAGQPEQVTTGFQLAQEPDFNAEADKLREYLRPFRSGNVGEALPAALVAVLGGHPKVVSLLRELLHGSVGLGTEDFVGLLLGDRADGIGGSMQSTRFLVDIVRGDRTITRTVTGEEITVEFTQDIPSLIVGDPSDLWFTHYYRSRMDTACHRLRLRWIDDAEVLRDPVAVFASTIQTIILKVHCNGVASLCPSGIREVLSGIADAGQTDLKRSRSYLLDMAEARLRELGVKDVPELNLILQKFNEARQARVDAELLASNAPARAKQRSEDAERLSDFAKRELVRLLEADQENRTQQGLVEAVRRKMNDYQYNAESIAFELFQNADDALAELEEMQNGEEPHASRFVLRLGNQHRMVEIVHWGRPINRYEYPGFDEGIERGYDQDLQKMLTLNFSDKGVSPRDHRAFVTGRFGLGFKSVFFLAQQPEVVSGRLAFCIKGGFFPVPLSNSVAEDLRASASALGPTGLTPTAIRLRWEQQVRDSDVANAIDHFIDIAPILPIFARRIRTLTVTQDDTTTTWMNVETKLTESGRLTYAEVGNRRFLCCRCPIGSDERPATVLFHVDSNGISPLPTPWTGLWITTPTAERTELGFALNAPFKPDAGRQRLPLNNHENRAIARELAQVWGEVLIELFDRTTIAWNEFSNALKLHSGANPESWWNQVWQETSRSSPVTHWKNIQSGGQILSWMAWGRPDGAMRGLFQHRAAIPTDLPGEYAKLVKEQDLKFSVAGLLADTSNGCFLQVSKWPSTRSAFAPGLTVHSRIAAYLQNAEFSIIVETVTLQDVLRVVVSPECQADYAGADRVGSVFIHYRALLEPNGTYAPEVQRLLGWMKEMRFLAEDGKYHLASELVCRRVVTTVIEEDEALRAAFAPESAVLAGGYTDAGLSCFSKARGQLAAGSPTLANWAHDASADRLQAVFNYLVRGDLGQQFADHLNRSWLDVKRETAEWQALPQEDKNEIERKFLKGYHWVFPPVFEVSPSGPEVRQEMDGQTAFALVSEWWRREHKQWVDRYEAKTYPIGFPGALPWPGDDEWDAGAQPSVQTRWLLLFVHAALVPLGFNMIGRDQGFSQFLVSRGWLDVFAGAPQRPEALLTALDEYLGAYVQNTEYHFQMRQFVAFYAVAKNLEALLLSLKETEKSKSAQNLRVALSPRANPALTGTGIDAPPLTGMLGIGSCHLLRELYRLGRLSNPIGHRFAFTPIRKVRRICTQLFGIPEGPSSISSSEIIFDALSGLGKTLGLDPSFNRCFDLPLQFLAQDGELRTTVLGKSFDVVVDDDDIDASP